MSNSDSTAPSSTGKPNKPYPDFPLFAHATKRWAKKIKGSLHYFGAWNDPQSAPKLPGVRGRSTQTKGDQASSSSKTASSPTKPCKPYPEFPLFPHNSGQWAKKIRGVIHYFGLWSNPDGAIKKYLEQKEALHAGRKPREASTGVTVKDMCNAYLNHKKALLDGEELSPRTFQNSSEATTLFIEQLEKTRLVIDLGQDDFADLKKHMAKKWGPVRLGDFIQRIQCVFKYAYDSELIAAPVRFGPGFTRPTKKTLRLSRAKRGIKMFEAEEIRRMVNGATVEGEGGSSLSNPQRP